MKAMKYLVAVVVSVLSLCGCSEDVKEMPPRVSDISSDFVLPVPPKLTNAESDMVEAKRAAYYEAYGD